MDAHRLNLDGCGVIVIVLTNSLVVVRLAPTSAEPVCPCCDQLFDRVHSRYLWTLADLACHDRMVLIRLDVRRFRCLGPTCIRSIFSERLPGLVQAYARTTARLTEIHRLVGLALGGEAGSRMAHHLEIPTSPDTVLRRAKRTVEEPPPAPRFVGIDDWAWRKGKRYGTIVVDLERGRVIDLLPDRNAETVKGWLAAHPGVELISRDRWSAYAQAAAEGAPQARQVVDRWHLLKNLREAIERLFERHSGTIKAALPARAAKPTLEDGSSAPVAAETATGSEPSGHQAPGDSAADLDSVQIHQSKRRRRVERFEQVRELHRQGRSVRGIARDLAMSRKSVRCYLRRETCPDWSPGRRRRSGLDTYQGWFDARLEAGCRNAAGLHRELIAKGCHLSSAAVRRYVTKRLGAAGKQRERANAAPSPVVPPPSPKQLSFDWIRRPEDRETHAQVRLETIRSHCTELAAALDLADEFTRMVRKQPQGTLADWLVRAEHSKCAELRRFAEGSAATRHRCTWR